MLIFSIILTILFLASLYLSFFIFKGLNSYIASLEDKIAKNIQVTENLKQSFRDVLLDATFLLDDGKIRPTPIQKEKNIIINGNPVIEEGKEI